MKRRVLKKIVNKSMDLLYTDCVFSLLTDSNKDRSKIEDLIQEISTSQKDLIRRINVSEGRDLKKRTKAYYKKLKTDLKNQIDQFGLEIEKLG